MPLYGHMLFIFLCKYLGMEWLGHVCLTFQGTATLFLKCLQICNNVCTFSSWVCRSSSSLCPGEGDQGGPGVVAGLMHVCRRRELER